MKPKVSFSLSQPVLPFLLRKSRRAALLQWALAFLVLASPFASRAQDAAAGEKLFEENCTSCHAVNSKVVGPALNGVHIKHKEEYLIRWIKNSQKVIQSGDPYAVALFKEYNGSIMSNFEYLSDGDVKNIIAYIGRESAATPPPITVIDGKEPVAKSDLPLFLYIGAIVLGVFAALMVGRLISRSLRLRGIRLFNWNSINAALFLFFLVGFFAFVAWQWGMFQDKLLPEAASEHGKITDQMMWFTFTITFVVFIFTHILLFCYAYMYRGKEGKRGYFYPDNKALEFFWTLIPAIVLTGMVLYGSRVWLKVTTQEIPKDVNTVEVFAKQFEWRARYSGKDAKLGKHNYRLIGSNNAIGLDPKTPESMDDIVIKELHLPVNEPVLFKFRSQDVIHSAYIPFFRMQMNVVPGMPTQFFWTPTVTTKEMRGRLGDGTFDYEMACNKVCGVSHFNMRLKVTIETQAEYQAWLASQTPYLKPTVATDSAAAPAATAPAATTTSKNANAVTLR